MVFLVTRDRLGRVSWTAPAPCSHRGAPGVRHRGLSPGPGRTEGWTPDGHRTDTGAAHGEPPADPGRGRWGSVLALKKGKWSKSAKLRGERVVLALAEGVFGAPPDVDWILEAFHGPKSTGGVPFQLLRVPSTAFQPHPRSRARELGHPPAFPHQGSNSIISPVFVVKIS